MTTKIVHLVDDTNPGGVMRGLNYLQKSEALGPNATSVVIAVRRGAISAPNPEVSPQGNGPGLVTNCLHR